MFIDKNMIKCDNKHTRAVPKGIPKNFMQWLRDLRMNLPQILFAFPDLPGGTV